MTVVLIFRISYALFLYEQGLVASDFEGRKVMIRLSREVNGSLVGSLLMIKAACL